MRGKLVVGNWKMNGGLRQNDALLAALARGLDGDADGGEWRSACRFPILWQAQAALSGSALAWGAQNVSEHAAGAFTGEVAAAMLAEFGCRYAIVGHSERRPLYGETDAVVAAKAAAALAAGLTPIVCVGETLAEREAGATEAVVLRQLDAVAGGARREARADGRRVRAGVGDRHRADGDAGAGAGGARAAARAARRQARRRTRCCCCTAAASRRTTRERCSRCADIDGGLIGGASLKADEFLAIARA